MNAHRYYGINSTGVTKSIAKLSSGYRINSAADDAAGLAISEKMRAQIRGLTMASKNTQDGISLIQTAEGGLQEIDNMLQRIRELVVYASNDTQEHNELSTGDRQKIQDEINALVEEIDSMSERVEFNKKTLLNGSCGGSADPALTAALTKARATYNSEKATVGAYEAQIAADEKTYADLVSKISNAISSMKTDGEALNQIASSGIDTFMTSFALSVGSVLTSLQALNKTSSTEAAVANLKEGGTYLTAAVGSLASAVDFLDTNAEAHALADKIDKNIKTIDETAKALGSALKRLNESGARSELATEQGKLNTAESAYIKARQDIASAGGGNELYFQVGANANQGISVSIDAVTSLELGVGDGRGHSSIDVLDDTGKSITGQLDILDEALSYVTTQRSRLGAVQNRMEYTQSSLDISAENLSNAESRIRDVDMAKEMTQFTKMNILFQASTAMLAQANALPQGVLQMLG
jgi:flagellin